MANLRNASKAFRRKLLDDKRNYKIKLVTTLANNTVLDDIIEKDIWTSSFKFSDATSGTTSFDLGSAIINKLNFALNNMYNKYSAYDFNGATVICHVGLTLDDGTTEYLKIGHFTVYEQPSYNGSLISFICYDNMYKFDKKITGMTGDTMGVVVANICSAVGVSINTPQFNGYDLPITLPTNITSMTYRQLLSYIAQLTGNFARINSDGLLEIKWYDTDFYSSESNLDGGTFKTTTTPYSDGDNANGGDFTFSETTDYNGGTFTELTNFHHIYSLNSQSFSTDDVIITGVKLTDSSQKVYSIGTTEYALSIENNPLVTPTNAQTYLSFLGNKLIGMRFRKFNISCLSDPTIECGDNAKISDNKGHTYYSFVNSNTFNIGNFQPIACNCASPLQNSSEKNSATTQTIINARKVADEQVSAYDLLVKQMTDLIANGFGVFKSEVIDENGGKIYYTHDKKLMSDSSVRWYQTSEGQIEQNKINGVWTTVSAQDSSGNALIKVLTAIGIKADWILAGTVEAEIIAKKLTMQGGSINITTSSENDNLIKLISSYYRSELSPYSLTCSWGYENSHNESNFYPSGISQYIDGVPRAYYFNTGMSLNYSNGTTSITADADTGYGHFTGNLQVDGTKNRIVKTDNYNKVLQYCVESPSPMFEDIGNATLDENGICYVDMESIFSETIDLNCDYFVQLTKYGQGELWVDDRQKDYFIVKGTPNLKFSWSLKARQKGYVNERLDKFTETNKEVDTDYIALANQYLSSYEREVIEE